MYKVKIWLSCIEGIPYSILVSKKSGVCVATFGLGDDRFSFMGHYVWGLSTDLHSYIHLFGYEKAHVLHHLLSKLFWLK
jgi:hypothetical protein